MRRRTSAESRPRPLGARGRGAGAGVRDDVEDGVRAGTAARLTASAGVSASSRSGNLRARGAESVIAASRGEPAAPVVERVVFGQVDLKWRDRDLTVRGRVEVGAGA